MLTLNKHAYSKLVQEDIEWLLENTERTLEREHIILVLNWSMKTYNAERYPEHEDTD